ncbi:MAG: DUF3047 domain-containing protein [Deltaproteobacteria bacterium]|nr:MAG: DUF3047 domain-containing protein [Deltaproteobacteria bacterium]
MKKSLVMLFLFLLAFGTVGVAVVSSDEPELVRTVEDFSSFEEGSFPEGWKSRGGEGSEVYRVRSDHEPYLEANAKQSAVTIAKKFEYDLTEYPYLSWQWRVIELPKGGDERYKKTGDSAAAIYVIFEGRLRPKSIKYVWSASLSRGTTTESPYNSKTKIVVMQNQSSPMGEWVSERVNVYADYQRLFGGETESVQAIGLMSDSDNTQSTAVAHYKAIKISKE